MSCQSDLHTPQHVVIHQDSPLFNFVENGVQRFMSHPYFVKRLKLGIQLISRDASLISAHSLRRGGATLSFLCNVPAEQIKARGDWASDCYQRYIDISPEANMNVARALGTAAASRPSDHMAHPPPERYQSQANSYSSTSFLSGICRVDSGKE